MKHVTHHAIASARRHTRATPLLSDNRDYLRFIRQINQIEKHGSSPFFRCLDRGNTSRVDVSGQTLDNFCSYNYLGLTSEPAVVAAAKDAIDTYGTSVSASRIVSGENSLHRELERELAAFLGTGDCLCYVSGHATNVSTIGHLFGPHDVILHDEQIHNSALLGCKLSGAKHWAFRHNDLDHLEQLLQAHAGTGGKTLILVEGVYSMEGDIAPLPGLVRLKERHGAFLMVDEAHSVGVLGATGRGIREHFGLPSHSVDLWMGTLSKAFASCGGYVAGSEDLIEYLKYTSPGFVYSVGMPPASAAAALAALRFVRDNPLRVRTLQERAAHFARSAAGAGLNTMSLGITPIVPVPAGETGVALKACELLYERGVHVAPILYQYVGRQGARLRFFITAQHTTEQLDFAVCATARTLQELRRKGA